jgi:hypothetical protein
LNQYSSCQGKCFHVSPISSVQFPTLATAFEAPETSSRECIFKDKHLYYGMLKFVPMVTLATDRRQLRLFAGCSVHDNCTWSQQKSFQLSHTNNDIDAAHTTLHGSLTFAVFVSVCVRHVTNKAGRRRQT